MAGLKPMNTNSSQVGPALKESRAGVIYSRLFKSSQQHTTDYTKNNWAPQLSMPAMSPTVSNVPNKINARVHSNKYHLSI